MPVDSKETGKLRAITPALKTQLIPHMQDVASEMNAQVPVLLPDHDLTAIQNFQPGSENTMTNKMIAAIKEKVKANPEHYYTFLEILRKQEDRDLNTIISELEFGMSLKLLAS